MVMRQSTHDDLQHPRRNLGNRYRTQAQKFVRLAKADPERKDSNLQWAEQNARQALLHDFTDERNWRCLADIKVVSKIIQALVLSWKLSSQSLVEIRNNLKN